MEIALVTGGAGFIGSHIAERLVKEGYAVKILDDFSSGKEKNIERIKKDVEIIRGDVQIREVVWDAMKGVDYVFHEAAMVSVSESVKNPAKCWKVNITGTQHVFNGAAKNNVKRVMIASSAAVYGNKLELPKREDMDTSPVSPYGDSKVMNEINAIKFYNENSLESVCLRYFNVYGPKQDPNSPYSGVISKFIGCMSKGEAPTIFGDGKQTRDFIYVSDVVEANMLAMKEKKAVGLTLNIATGKQTSLLDLVYAINSILGKKLAPIFAEERKGDIKHSYADVSKAKEMLGFEAKVGLKEGLEKTIKWYSRSNE